MGGRNQRDPLTDPYKGQAAYVRSVVTVFTRRHNVRIPADATLGNPAALMEWCIMLREARLELGLDRPNEWYGSGRY